MSFTITPHLKSNKKNSKDQFAIYLRLYLNGQTVLKSTKYYASENQWDNNKARLKEKGSNVHPQAEMINGELRTMEADLTKRYDFLRVNGEGNVDLALVKNDIKADGVDPMIRNDMNIFTYVNSHINFMITTNPEKHKEGEGRVSIFRNTFRMLEKYLDGTNLMFSQINVKFLKKMQMDMKTLEYGGNTIRENMKVIKQFCEQAHTEGVINFKPFAGYKLPEAVDVKKKEYLTLAELDMVEEYISDIDDHKVTRRKFYRKGTSPYYKKLATLYLLFGCCTGLRVSDWYRFDPRKHITKRGIAGMVTKKTGEPVVIPATKRLLRLFEFMKRHPLTTEQLKDINENIGEAMADLEINKHITSHCGRKTFAVELCANSGISCEVCATLMAIDMQTCVDSYYDVTEEKIGKEVELFWKNF